MIQAPFRTLSRTIFGSLLVFTLLIIGVLSCAFITLSYHAEETHTEQNLIERARMCAAVLDAVAPEQRTALIQEQFPGPERYTLIDTTGEVVYDSYSNGALLDNHYERPEMLAAENEGEGVLIRRSETQNIDAIYVAERLGDGWFVRVSEERLSLVAFFGTLALPIGLVLCGACLVVVAISRLLTHRIMKPLNALDVNNPLASEGYEEMRPLLVRIDEQQQLLKQQNEELKRAEGLRQEFSANVSHEMKTPLQVIAGSAEMIAHGMVAPQDIQNFGSQIYRESQRLRALINDVLTLSRLDDPAFVHVNTQQVDLYEIVRRTYERLQPIVCEKSIAMSLIGEHVVVKGNESLLEQAVVNLMENALRYTSAGGTVMVSVEQEMRGHVLDAQGTKDNTSTISLYALVEVKDTGMGISEEDQPKVFERFYRTEKSRSKETGGTGLGLAIVKHVALTHGGDVSVKSVLGEGSTFTMRIPL